MADKSVSFRLGVVGGDRARAEFASVGNAGRDAFRDIDRFSRSGSAGLQNVGFQVQDFAVQVGAGTSASQALAQQLPQLLSGFGLLGIAMGTASAVLIPLARVFFGTKEEAQSASEAVTAFGQSLNSYEAFVVTAATSTADLTAKFGEFAGRVQGFSEYLAGVSLGQTFEELLATVTALNAPMQEVRDRFVTLAEAKSQLARISNEDAYGLFTAQQAVEAARDSLGAAGDALGLTAEKALVLSDAIDAVGQAEGVREIAIASSEALAVMKSLVPAGQELPGPLRDAAFALGEMANRAAEVATETGIASDAIAVMNNNLADAYGLYANLRAQAAALTQENINAAMAASALAYGKIQNTGEGGADQAAREAIARRPNPFGRVSSGAAGVFRSTQSSGGGRAGGGGGGGGVPRISDDEREAARIFDETRTAAEKYAIELKKLNDLKASGALDSDTYARAMEALKETTDDATEKAKALNAEFESTFANIVTGAKSGEEALADLFNSLADQLARSAFAGLNTGLFGQGGIGAFLAPFFGGGRAGGGPVLAGRSYMVGESGPEMVTMGGNGYVTSNAALRSAVGAGGGPVIQIDARYATEGTAAMIAKAIQRAAPAIVKQSVAANRAAGARGY
jgi:hypothetical protein